MKDLTGKKLLVISSDGSDIEFVKAAKEMGMHVACCDRYEDWNISPAKLIADEAWNMDYSDTEAVAKKCREEKIDGVIAGYSEDRVLAACRISKAIGTPFYATEEQINLTRDKRLFKKTCIECGVNTPQEFCFGLPMKREDLDKIKYPVIVKPSDNGGRKGISVCENENELTKAIEAAAEYSKTGEVVVEEYLRGVELSAVYTISNGESSFSCLNDKYLSEEDGTSCLCDFVITPSRFYDEFLKTIDPGIKKLLKKIGAVNGVANFQLIAGADGIKAFEMGFRVNGNNDFKVIRKYNDIDFMKMLISYVTTGDMGDDLNKNNPDFSEYYCTLTLLLKAGTISKIDYSKLDFLKNIDDISIWKRVGDVIPHTGTNAQKAGMIKFSAKDMNDVKSTVQYIHENLIVENENGENMKMKAFNIQRLN